MPRHRRVDHALPVRLHRKHHLLGKRKKGVVTRRGVNLEKEVVVYGAADGEGDFCRRTAENGGGEVFAQPGNVLRQHGE